MNDTPTPSTSPTSPSQQRCGLATASLVLGILGIVSCLGPVFGVPGVICGHVASSRIRRSGGALSGEGVALAGLITGYIAIAMVVVTVAVAGMLAAIAVPNFVRARESAQKNACVMNLRAIEGAKATWALENKKRANDVPQDSDLFGPGRYMPLKPVCPAGGTYTLGPVEEKPTCSIPNHAY